MCIGMLMCLSGRFGHPGCDIKDVVNQRRTERQPWILNILCAILGTYNLQAKCEEFMIDEGTMRYQLPEVAYRDAYVRRSL